jgi:iron(III) transport system permease protein
MHDYRWLRAFAKSFLRLILLMPVVALLLAMLVDHGPSGNARLSLFPMALVALDPFVWTCFRNSLIFATLSSSSALILGVGLGWIVARRRFWGRAVLHGGIAALSPVAPAFVALGLLGLVGLPYEWPWPFSKSGVGTHGASLESWRGLSLWVVWLWTSLPGGVALVAMATVAAVERLEPSWEDAARLAGSGPFRASRDVSWPLVRPLVARAVALIFTLALVEPGAPWILGLRRTIAYQIVDAIARPDPFPRLAIWASTAGLIALAGWMLIGRWGGPRIPTTRGKDSVKTGASRLMPLASFLRAAGSSFLLGSWLILAWLPMLGLVRLTLGDGWSPAPSVAEAVRRVPDALYQLVEPPLPQLAYNSVLLGLEVALVLMVLGWLVGTDSRSSSVPTRWEQSLIRVPPLVQGVGLLALSWLAGMAAGLSVDGETWRRLAIACERLSDFTNVDRNPWMLLSCSTALALVGAVLSIGYQSFDSGPSHSNAAFDAARLAGSSRSRARSLSIPRQRRRWLGRLILIWALAATNLTPALLFTPWTDGRTVAPGVLVLADGPPEARAQAAALALCIFAVNVAALALARLTSALPRADS